MTTRRHHRRLVAALVALASAAALTLPTSASADVIIGGTFTLPSSTPSTTIITGGTFTLDTGDPSAVTTIAASRLYWDYARGVAAQFSAVCDPGVVVDGYPSLTHGSRLLLPLPSVRPFNVTADWDSQTVDYVAYLFRWNGTSWVYANASDRATYWVAEWSVYSGFASRSDGFELPAGPGYYRVAVSYRWTSNQTGAIVNSLYYWAPITEANGADASWCTFNG
jgi:hypothetical protein